MAKQTINVGNYQNDKAGDALRTAFIKVNENFTELYSAIGADVQIPIQTNNSGKYLTTNGTTLSWSTVSSPSQLVNGNKTVSLGTEGKLTLPAGTTYEYFNTPLAGHGDGLARLDFALMTDGVITSWIAASANPAGSGYSIGDTFTFDEVFLGIPGASVTIGVLSIGPGGSVEDLGFTAPPLYPADIYRDSPINLQVGTTSSNRWTFGASGDLTVPGGITFPDGLNIINSTVGRETVNTITEEIPGGFASSTTAIANQITIDTTDSISIERTITQTVYDGVATATDIAGSLVVVDSTNAYIKHFVEPDGPNNSSYFQVRTGNDGAIIEGVNEEVAGNTVGRVTATQGVVDISTSFEGVDKHWLFDMTGDLVIPGNIDLPPIVSLISTGNNEGGTSGSIAIASDFQSEIDVSGTAINVTNNITNQQIVEGWTIKFADGTIRVANANTGNTGPGGEYIIAYDTPYESLNGFPITAYGLDYTPAIPANISIEAGPATWSFNSDGNLYYPDGSFGGTAFIGDANRLYGNVDQDVEVIVRHQPTVSAECAPRGSGNNFVADTTDNDDITVVQEGWTVDIDGTTYTVTTVMGGIGEFDIFATGATFVIGTTYTFTNPTATLKTWTFNNETGTLRAPGGALLSSETAVVGEGDAYRDFSIEILNPTGTNEYRWLFDNTAGDLTVPGAIKHGDSKLAFNVNGGTNVYLTPTTDDSTAVFINDISVQAYARESVGLQVGAGLSVLEEAHILLEAEWVNAREADAFIAAPTIRAWQGLASWLAYPILLNSSPDLDPPMASNLPTIANSAKNAYNLWQNTKSDTTISMAVDDKVWVFDTDGNLTLPRDLKFNDGVSNISAVDPAQSGGVGGLSVNGKDRTYIVISSETFGYNWDFRAFGLNDETTAKPAIKFPGNGWLQEDLSNLGIGGFDVPTQLGSQGAFTLTVKDNSTFPDPASTYNWIFGTDGSITLPADGTVSYTPATASDWNGTPPTTLQEAIDRLAAAIKALNSTGA